MQQNKEVIATLGKHINSTVSLVNTLKQKNSELETQIKVLTSENLHYKSDIQRHADQIMSYEDKMKSLEKLLEDAETEQGLLEQSILTAITNLAKFEDNTQPQPSPSHISDNYDSTQEDGNTIVLDGGEQLINSNDLDTLESSTDSLIEDQLGIF